MDADIKNIRNPKMMSLRLILRLMKCQHGLAIGILEIVRQCKGLGPVCAVPIADLEHPGAVGLVAAIHQQDAAG